jgi:hypothetical protein
MCFYLAPILRAANYGLDISVCTFGSPRPGGTTLANQIRGMAVARWMCSEDPVCQLPIRVDEAEAVIFVYGLRAAQRVGYFCQPYGGLDITFTGKITVADTPTSVSVSPVSSLVSWMLSQDSVGNNFHAIQVYVSRLLLASQSLGRSVAQGLAEGSIEAVAAEHKNRLSSTERAVARTIFNAGEMQNSVTQVAPRQRQFTAFREGRLWLVAWNDTIVAVAPNKRRARALARVGNDWLDRLQLQAYTDTSGLVTQLQDYLANAVLPDQGWNPPINNVLP